MVIRPNSFGTHANQSLDILQPSYIKESTPCQQFRCCTDRFCGLAAGLIKNHGPDASWCKNLPFGNTVPCSHAIVFRTLKILRCWHCRPS